MARIRTIKPEFWTDEDMAEVSEAACLLAIGLLNYADDEGYFNANPKLIKAAVFPIREPSVTIPVMLRELSNRGYLTLFSSSDSKHFGLINNFAKHQVVNKPRASKIKGMKLVPESYGSDTGGLPLGMDQGSGNGKDNPHSSAYARETASAVTLESPGAVVHIGIPITAEFETLDINIDGQETLLDKKLLISAVTLVVNASRGIWASTPGGKWYEYPQREFEFYDEPVTDATGKVEVKLDSNWDKNGRVKIRQTDPLPLSVLAVIPRLTVGGY